MRLALALLLLAGPALARDLLVRLPPDTTILRDIILRPFTAVTGLPTEAREQGGDVALVTSNEMQEGCDTRFARLDWVALGGKDGVAAADCGIGAVLGATILAWDRDKYQAMPGWAEFWDVARAPGKRGLPLGPRGTLEFALLADGVAPADVYRALRGDAGIDRAFRKLDQLRPYIVWWQDDAQAARILASGEVLMTSAPAATIQALGRSNFAAQWTGGLAQISWWVLARDSDIGDPATRFMAYAASPLTQARLAQTGAYASLAAPLPEGMLPADETFWRDNLPRLAARFDAWLAK